MRSFGRLLGWVVATGLAVLATGCSDDAAGPPTGVRVDGGMLADAGIRGDSGLDAGRRSYGNVDAGDILTCIEAEQLFESLPPSDPTLLACERDDDCTLLPVTLSCAIRSEFGPFLFPCSAAIAKGSVDAGLARAAQAQEALCPRIEIGSPCLTSPSCIARQPRCVDHLCTAAHGLGTDDGGLP